MNKKNEFYDSSYFSWQSSIGEFGGWANLPKFSRFITEDDFVLDFGCGGGYLLKNINCKKRVGLDVNIEALLIAKANGLDIYHDFDDIPDDYFDVIISNHALEHCYSPYDDLQKLYNKLKSGGKIIFVIPCETIHVKYKEKDQNQHLYSWGPMTLGNLFSEAGFSVVESKPYFHKWPLFFKIFAKIGGRGLFDLASRVYARIERSSFQIRVIAEK